jgi:hypothetical protein
MNNNQNSQLSSTMNIPKPIPPNLNHTTIRMDSNQDTQFSSTMNISGKSILQQPNQQQPNIAQINLSDIQSLELSTAKLPRSQRPPKPKVIINAPWHYWVRKYADYACLIAIILLGISIGIIYAVPDILNNVFLKPIVVTLMSFGLPALLYGVLCGSCFSKGRYRRV